MPKIGFGRGGARGGGKSAPRGGGPETGGGGPRPEAQKSPSRAEARKAWLKKGAERVKSILLLRGIRKQETAAGALEVMAGNPPKKAAEQRPPQEPVTNAPRPGATSTETPQHPQVTGAQETIKTQPRTGAEAVVTITDSNTAGTERQATAANQGTQTDKVEQGTEDAGRLAKAEQLLQKELTPEQQQAILTAHNIGNGEGGKKPGTEAGISNYTSAQLREKAQVLKDAGLSKEARRALIEEGIVGSAAKTGAADAEATKGTQAEGGINNTGQPQGPEDQTTQTAEAQQRGGMTPPTAAEAAQQTPESVADAKLVGNTEYQQRKQVLEQGAENQEWRDIDSMVHLEEVQGEKPDARQDRLATEQDNQDNRIDGLPPDRKEAYEKYVKEREAVKMIRQEAVFDARAEAINAREAGIANLPEAQRAAAQETVRRDRSQLDMDRTDARLQSEFATDTKYQANKRRAGKIERAIRRLKHEGQQAYSDEWIKDLADGKLSWKDIKEHEKYLVGEKKIFKDKRAFREYEKARDQRNKKEDKGEGEQAKEMISNSNMSDKEVQELLEDTLAKRRKQPGRLKRMSRGFGRFADNIIGSGPMKENKKKAAGYAKGLVDIYGWRGLFAQRLLPKADQKGAKILRRLMFKELAKYAGRSLARGVLMYILISLAAFAITPVVMAKTIDAIKPFSKQ